jgi:hypothetical protein
MAGRGESWSRLMRLGARRALSLNSLDERMLRDIGFSRADAAAGALGFAIGRLRDARQDQGAGDSAGRLAGFARAAPSAAGSGSASTSSRRWRIASSLACCVIFSPKRSFT